MKKGIKIKDNRTPSAKVLRSIDRKMEQPFQISSDQMDEGVGVSLVFLLPSGSDQLSVSRGLHEAWERCSEQGFNLRWADEEIILKLRAPIPEQEKTYQDML